MSLDDEMAGSRRAGRPILAPRHVSLNPKSISILSDPAPCSHIVYPYTDEKHIVEAVGLFASAGLQRDEAVVLVATKAHCDAVVRRLKSDSFDIPRLERADQFICADAEDLLSGFMVNGMPDENLFKDAVAGLIGRAKRGNDGSRHRTVRIFGEMVSLLWIGNEAAAARLEVMWNEVIEAHSVSLLCAYSLDRNTPQQLPHSLLAPHSCAIA
jgi:hypothetical protein